MQESSRTSDVDTCSDTFETDGESESDSEVNTNQDIAEDFSAGENLQKGNDEFKRSVEELLAKKDIGLLREIAYKPGGFCTDEIRAKVWPFLGRIDFHESSPVPSEDDVKKHPYYTQVVLDVNRSIKRFPPSIKEEHRISLQDKLVYLIMRILIKNPNLHYYQGYHDVCVTLLLVLGEEQSFALLDRLSRTKLACHMGPTMDKTSLQLDIIYSVLQCEHPKLCEFLDDVEVGTIFCLSWVITWFGHVLAEYEHVVRLYDLFIAHDEHLLPVYLSAAIVLRKTDDILRLDHDMAQVHLYLSHLVDEPALPIEDLIQKALQLCKNNPPEEMEKLRLLRKVQLEEKRRRREIAKKRPVHQGPLRYLSALYRNATGPWKGTFAVAAAVMAVAVVYQFYRQNFFSRFARQEL